MSNLNQHLIDPTLTAPLAEEYVKSNYAEINRKRPAAKPDSRTYSMELEVLQEYLKLISSEMDKRGIKSKGIKVTMGKYPEKSTDPKLKAEYLGYQMIFFSPIDLGTRNDKNLEATQDSNSFVLGEIPDLNYMNITPPY